jgi:hypothetical protein
MRTESNIKPAPLIVERCADGLGEVVFRENITEQEREEGTVYVYDEYRTAVPYRDNLLSTVKKSKAAWLERAKADEAAIEQPPPSLEEQIKSLQTENEKLRESNDIIGAALEEVILTIYGGE